MPKTLRSLTFFIGLWFFVLELLAQSPRLVTGTLIDDEANMPLSYATVALKGSTVGALTNDDGTFTLMVPDTMQQIPETILISTLGYETLEVLTENYLNGGYDTIRIGGAAFTLDSIEVVSNPCRRTKGKRVGNNKNGGLGLYSAGFGGQVAVFFPNEDALEGQIEKAYFYVSTGGAPYTEFRVRLYLPDGENNSPGSDLLTESVICSINDPLLEGDRGRSNRKNCHFMKRLNAAWIGGWVEVDLKDYHLEIPENGFFVAMEWLPDQMLRCDAFSTGKAQVLGGVVEKNTRPCFTWSKSFLHGWKAHIATKKHSNTLNAMIRTTIKICK